LRALVDLMEAQVQALDRLARRRERSRASLIREAVDDYLCRNGLGSDDDGFGLWGAEPVDGLAFQERLRREW
jgi:predicted transcriptional regulator